MPNVPDRVQYYAQNYAGISDRPRSPSPQTLKRSLWKAFWKRRQQSYHLCKLSPKSSSKISLPSLCITDLHETPCRGCSQELHSILFWIPVFSSSSVLSLWRENWDSKKSLKLSCRKSHMNPCNSMTYCVACVAHRERHMVEWPWNGCWEGTREEEGRLSHSFIQDYFAWECSIVTAVLSNRPHVMKAWFALMLVIKHKTLCIVHQNVTLSSNIFRA